MKPRSLFLVILVVGLVGGVAWWMRPVNPGDRTNPPEATNVAAAKLPAPSITAPNQNNKPAGIDPASLAAAPSERRPTVAPPPANLMSVPIFQPPPASANYQAKDGTSWASLPFRFEPGPADGPALVRTAMIRDLGVQKISQAAHAMSQRQVMQPLPVYELFMSEVGEHGGMENAHFIAFYYLIEANGEPMAEATLPMPNGVVVKPSVGFSPSTISTANALAQLGTLDQVQKGAYEARLLESSVGHLLSIWLKSNNGSPDIIYLVNAIPDGLAADKPYSVDEVLAVLRPLYVEELADDQRLLLQRQQRQQMKLTQQNQTQ